MYNIFQNILSFSLFYFTFSSSSFFFWLPSSVPELCSFCELLIHDLNSSSLRRLINLIIGVGIQEMLVLGNGSNFFSPNLNLIHKTYAWNMSCKTKLKFSYFGKVYYITLWAAMKHAHWRCLTASEENMNSKFSETFLCLRFFST